MTRSGEESPCRGPSRRELLRVGVLSAWGLGLEDFFRLKARAGQEPSQTSAPKAKAKACILVWLAGGPSHIDTLDPKPDAPKEYRGEFKAIDTTLPGVKLSEVFPNLAKTLDKTVLIRSMTSPEAEHDRAAHHYLTGYRPSPALVYPGWGSVLAKSRGFGKSTLPPHVAIPDAPLFSSSGYLSPAYDPFLVGGDPNQDGFRVRDLTPPDRVTLERLLRRRSMVKSLDGFAREIGSTPLTAGRDQFADQAYDLLTSNKALAAFKIGDEDSKLRERYGRNPFGQSLLLARRLVESGVSFITVNDRGMGQLGWDTHAQNFPTIKNTLAPPLDQGLSALISDLIERNLFDSTLIVMMGEFGRTPRVNSNAGRDHFGRANSILLAGGGLPKGLALGRSDSRAEGPADRPITPADLAATVFTTLGIDPSHRFETPDGQPIRVVDKGEAIKELV